MARALAFLCTLAAALVLGVAAPAAAQQDTPFGPVPTETPEPQGGTGDDDVSRTTLYLIGAGVLVLVVGIGWAISRDARRSLTSEDREALEREERKERGDQVPDGRPSKQARERARKQRAKVKAARRARRQNR